MMFRALVSLLVWIPLSLPAQTPGMPDGSKERAGLAPLSRLVGRWEGDATVMTGPNQTKLVRQFEEVVPGAGSTVLMVRGTGRLKDGDPGTIIYEAAATIWFDASSQKLRMRAHRMEGVAVEPDVELKGDTLIWAFNVMGGRIRYTTVFSDSTWHEVGHFLREGAPPMQMMEMRLRRISGDGRGGTGDGPDPGSRPTAAQLPSPISVTHYGHGRVRRGSE